MTLSFSKLNEIAYLYENAVHGEQEVLGEDIKNPFGGSLAGAISRGSTDQGKAKNREAVGNALSGVNKGASNLMQTGGIAGAVSRKISAARNAVQGPGGLYDRIQGKSSSTSVPAAKPPIAPKLADIRGGQGNAAPSKYKSSSDGKMYANYDDAKAARDSRLKDLAAKQQAAKPPATTPAKPPATTPATTPKVLPTKPAAPAKPAMGTTAGGTKFERRAATSAELKAAQDARAAAKAAGNTKGAEEAAVKAGVAAGKKPVDIKASYEYDAYDLVLEYLLSQGHAETVAEAQYLMTEMDAEMIGDIVEARMDPRGRPASGPMNVYAKSKGKPDQAHLDAVKSYDEKQKKKTPEQKKKELDDYRERQMNNK